MRIMVKEAGAREVEGRRVHRRVTTPRNEMYVCVYVHIL